VSWYEAAAFCHWLTGEGRTVGWLPAAAVIRLPTVREWERAARHTDRRRYPWAGGATPERANYDETGIGAPAPVGCFPAGAAVCGAEDLAGNVWEWLTTPWKTPERVAPKQDFPSRERVVGTSGSYDRDEDRLCCGARFGVSPFGSGGAVRLVWAPRIVT
jgi:formylglycine-generating enzyme required for sulfatase activity